MQLSKTEKAGQAVLSNDNMSVTMRKGYRMVWAPPPMSSVQTNLPAASTGLCATHQTRPEDVSNQRLCQVVPSSIWQALPRTGTLHAPSMHSGALNRQEPLEVLFLAYSLAISGVTRFI